MLLHIGAPAFPVISLLLVEPDVTAAAAVIEALPPAVEFDVRIDFPAARARLLARPPTLLVTALRLREYNGLHLVYLAARAGFPTRCVVYTDRPDRASACESRKAGAFYEYRSQLAVSLPAYARAVLPPADRREAVQPDRRSTRRGGRRAYDQPTVVAG